MSEDIREFPNGMGKVTMFRVGELGTPHVLGDKVPNHEMIYNITKFGACKSNDGQVWAAFTEKAVVAFEFYKK